MTTLLAAVWALRDVEDVEALCRGVVRECSIGIDPPLEACEVEDTIRHVLGEVDALEAKFDPTRDDPANPTPLQFRPWLYKRLIWATFDYWRKYLGRHGEKRVLDQRFLVQGVGDTLGRYDLADADFGVDSPGGFAQASATDAEADRALPRRWSELPADWGAGRQERGLGLRQGGGDAEGADRGGAAPRGRDGRRAARSPRGAPAWLDCRSCGWRHFANAPNGVDAWHYPTICSACGGGLG